MCLQEIKDEIIDAGKESVDIVNIGLHFFSRMFDLCCLL